jgi:hypothetical protein
VVDAHALSEPHDLGQVVPDSGLAAADLDADRVIDVVEHGLVHALYHLHRRVELVPLIGAGEADGALQIAPVGDLHDDEAGVLVVVRAEATTLRAFPGGLDGQLGRFGLLAGIPGEVLVILDAAPDDGPVLAVLRAFLVQVDDVVLRHLHRRDGLQAFRAQAQGLPDLFAHQMHQLLPSSEYRAAFISFANESQDDGTRNAG